MIFTINERIANYLLQKLWEIQACKLLFTDAMLEINSNPILFKQNKTKRQNKYLKRNKWANHNAEIIKYINEIIILNVQPVLQILKHMIYTHTHTYKYKYYIYIISKKIISYAIN